MYLQFFSHEVQEFSHIHTQIQSKNGTDSKYFNDSSDFDHFVTFKEGEPVVWPVSHVFLVRSRAVVS